MDADRKRWCTVGCCRDFLRVNLLVILTLIGVIVGFFIGFGVRSLQPSQDAVIWIGIPGEVYMRMLKMMILPLIICSVITGTASLDPKCNGRVSVVALTYIIVTNCVPCIVGIAMAYAIRPGLGVELTEPSAKVPSQVMETSDIFADLIRNLFPDNVVSACFQQAQTKYSMEESKTVTNVSGQLSNTTVITKVKSVGSAPSTNVLGLVLCCMVFGMATTAVGAAGQPFFAFFNSANEVIMRILRWFVWVLTTVISVAIPSVPSAGVVAVLINLTALNIPADYIGLLFAMEWIVDRLRSASNMLSHAYCAVTTYHFCKDSLPPLDAEGGALEDDIAAVEIHIPPPSKEKEENHSDAKDKLLKDSSV